MENLSSGLPGSPRADRRVFLSRLVGSFAFLSLGQESALGQGLLIRRSAQEDPPLELTCPTTLSQTLSLTLKPTTSPGATGTEVHSATTTEPDGTYTYTYTQSAFSATYPTVVPLRNGTTANATVTMSWVATPPGVFTGSASVNGGTIWETFTKSYPDQSVSRTLTYSITVGSTTKCQQQTPTPQGFQLPSESDPVMLLDTDYDLAELATRESRLLQLAF